MQALLLGTLLGLMAYGSASQAETTRSDEAASPLRIHLHVEGESAIALLADNPSARDFVTLLPLSLTLENYAVVERISSLPRRLSTANAPSGMTPQQGDITYYAPWGNLAIFVGDNRYARGLVPLGRVTEGLPALQRAGPLKVRIELMKE